MPFVFKCHNRHQTTSFARLLPIRDTTVTDLLYTYSSGAVSQLVVGTTVLTKENEPIYEWFIVCFSSSYTVNVRLRRVWVFKSYFLIDFSSQAWCCEEKFVYILFYVWLCGAGAFSVTFSTSWMGFSIKSFSLGIISSQLMIYWWDIKARNSYLCG